MKSGLFIQNGNSMKMEARTEQLLPLKKEDFGSLVIPADTHQEEIQMVPSPEAVLDHVVPNYVPALYLAPWWSLSAVNRIHE